MTSLLSDEELLAMLVGFDSTSHKSNLPLADFICEYLARPGIQVERVPSPDGDKVNLVVRVGNGDPGDRTGLALAGHMDVVPAEEPAWQSDPFTLTKVGDSYFGRGACDMKGFLALAINAAAAADPSYYRHPLVLVLTYDEEVGTAGARHLAGTWADAASLPKATIVGEPTSLRVIRMHKGYLDFRIVIEGLSAHSGYPHLGQSAIEPMGRLIVALTGLRETLEGETPPNAEYFPEVPFVPLNIARVTGGTALNIVPDRCTLDCCLRLLPGMPSDQIVDRVRQVIARAIGDARYSFAVDGEGPPMLLAEETAIYRALCSAMGQTETLSASYATDAGWLQELGMECAVWGPGSIEVAHKPNESIPISEFNRAAETLQRLIHQFCLD